MSNSAYRLLASGRFAAGSVKQSFAQAHSIQWSAAEGMQIGARWRAALERAAHSGTELYSSAIFRLGGCVRQGQNLVLEFGATSYRDFVATRDAGWAQSAQPVGAMVLPFTRDGYLPVGRRSARAETAPGQLFSFGGWTDMALDRDAAGQPDLWRTAQRELAEELGFVVALEDLTLLGLAHVLEKDHVVAVFETSLLEDRAAVADGNWREELQDLSFVARGDLPAYFDLMGEQMSTAFRAALALLLGLEELA